MEFHFRGRQINKVKVNCYFLDQVRWSMVGGGGGGAEGRRK